MGVNTFLFRFPRVVCSRQIIFKHSFETLALIIKGHGNGAELVLTLIYPQILNGFDPQVNPYFWTSKTTDCFKSITDSDLTALNAKIYEKFVVSLQE